MAESEEELKSLLMKVKVESEKVGLNQDSMVLAQKQKYTPVEQDRKPRNKPMHLWPLETTPDSRVSLECNPEIPAFPGEEYSAGCCLLSRGVGPACVLSLGGCHSPPQPLMPCR